MALGNVTGIVLKHSFVANDAPDATELTPGELALNANSGSLTLFTLDEAGVVRKVGRALPDQVFVTASGTAPANPTEGQLWVDTANGYQVKTWDNTQWVLTVPPASESTFGVARFATNAEMAANAADRIVDPAKLAGALAALEGVLRGAFQSADGSLRADIDIELKRVADEYKLADQAVTLAFGTADTALEQRLTIAFNQADAAQGQALNVHEAERGTYTDWGHVRYATYAELTAGRAELAVDPLHLLSMLNVREAELEQKIAGGIIYKGLVTPSDPAPVGPAVGELYIIDADAPFSTGWGAPLAGTDGREGEMVIYDGTQWDIVGQGAIPPATYTKAGLARFADQTEIDLGGTLVAVDAWHLKQQTVALQQTITATGEGLQQEIDARFSAVQQNLEDKALHDLADVEDSTTSVIGAAGIKGLLVRDANVINDGGDGAYKLVNVIDLGTF